MPWARGGVLQREGTNTCFYSKAGINDPTHIADRK